MSATYTPGARDRLSTVAQALDADSLETEVLVAEEILGLTGSSLTGDDALKAKRAVALQVNLQVRLASGEAADIRAQSKGKQSITYATVNGVRVPVDATAQAIVAGLLGPKLQSTVGSIDFRW
ncbi:MAG TPA: hypothetical protein VLH75_07315 [Longimicrobiales bacterium]|nr:hypothetical protein [Longimicrobiales bacterium]